MLTPRRLRATSLLLGLGFLILLGPQQQAAAARTLAQQPPSVGGATATNAAAPPAAAAEPSAEAAPPAQPEHTRNATDATAPAAEPAAVAQGPGPGQESKYGSPEVDRCIELTNSAGQACTVESDTLSLVYPRGSEELPTEDQISGAISNMKAAAQPSQDCCTSFRPYSDARCPCDPGYQQILPIGGFDPAYFEGATAILALACGFDFPPCKPGEVSKPSGRR